MCLTIYFDGQFWVGLVEEESGDGVRAFRHVFGAEPGDAEILEFVRGMMPVCSTSSAVVARPGAVSRVSPKRLARMASKALRAQGASTKAQEALSRQREEQKTDQRRNEREEREQRDKERRAAAVAKAKKRHKGH